MIVCWIFWGEGLLVVGIITGFFSGKDTKDHKYCGVVEK